MELELVPELIEPVFDTFWIGMSLIVFYLFIDYFLYCLTLDCYLLNWLSCLLLATFLCLFTTFLFPRFNALCYYDPLLAPLVDLNDLAAPNFFFWMTFSNLLSLIFHFCWYPFFLYFPEEMLAPERGSVFPSNWIASKLN